MRIDLTKIRYEYWHVKAISYSIIYALLAVIGYSLVAKLVVSGHSVLPPRGLPLPIDPHIPFISAFAIPYVFIFYLLVVFTLGYYFFVRTEKADQLIASILIIYAVAFLTYLIMPVTMEPFRPKPEELPSDFLSQVMANYYRSDLPVNCFPSLHAANSTIVAYYLSKDHKRYKWVFWGLAFLVILSTLFVRQHYIVDEIYGFLLAYFAGEIATRKISMTPPIEKMKTLRIAIALVLSAIISIGMIITYIP